jgi:hemolysin activation/secretion protein
MKKYSLIFLSLLTLFIPSAYTEKVPVNVDPIQVEKGLSPIAEPGAMQDPVITQQQKFDSSLPVDFYKKTILIKRVNLDGNSIFLDNELAKYYTSLIGKDVSLATLYEVAEKITNHYRREGYVLASAFIPEQELRNGLIKVKIVEGFISKINLEGDYDRNKIIDATVEKIYNIKPFNIKLFERYMLLLNELPGVAARAVLKKQTSKEFTFGGVDLDIVFSKENHKLGLGWNNNVTRYLGNFLSQLSYEHHNIGFKNHTTNLGIAVTDEFTSFQLISLSDKITLNSEGTNLFIEGSYIKMRPGRQLEKQKIKINSENGSVNISHPVIRSRIRNLVPYVGLSFSNSRTEAASFLTSKDKVRTFNLGVNYDFFDELKGANLINISMTKGLDIWGPSKKNSEFLSKEKAKLNFTKLNLRYARMQSLINDLSLYLSINSQHTRDTLLSSELTSFGGGNIGKGYDSSSLTGDNGYNFTGELRHKLPKLSLLNTEAFCFYDYGRAWNSKKTEIKNVLAISYGAGLRFNLGEFSSARLIIARPTTGKVFFQEEKKLKKPTSILMGLYIRA